MSYSKSYLLQVLADALAQEPIEQELPPPVAPAVAPPDAPPFPVEIMERLDHYKGKALLVQDFEGFMALLNAIANELKLNPATDLPKIAGVFNSYRVAEGLEPL